jgi:hypothetical protein
MRQRYVVRVRHTFAVLTYVAPGYYGASCASSCTVTYCVQQQCTNGGACAGANLTALVLTPEAANSYCVGGYWGPSCTLTCDTTLCRQNTTCTLDGACIG